MKKQLFETIAPATEKYQLNPKLYTVFHHLHVSPFNSDARLLEQNECDRQMQCAPSIITNHTNKQNKTNI